MPSEVDDVRARLESIAEELADLALDRLRTALGEAAEEAVDEGVTEGVSKPSDEERLMTRARRSVEKAAALLGQVSTDPPR